MKAPAWLGRGLVTRGPGDVRVDAATLRQPGPALEALGQAWRGRRPVTVELAVDPAELKERESWTGDVYELDPSFEFARERLHFYVWANNYDGTREGEPVWWHARLARKLGAEPSDQAEVCLEGRHVWCDGGPRGGLPEPVLHRESIEGGSLQLTLPGAAAQAELAPDQQEAVLHPAGAARIIAPAGSGKTRVLTARLRHLLQDRGYEKERVTALAYNRRAAREMEERTTDFKPHVRTLHAFGHMLQKKEVLEERQVRAILQGMLSLPRVLNQDPLAPYLEALAEVRLALRRPEEVERRRGDVEGLAKLFPRYRERLRRENKVDHDEQIYGALELLLADPQLRQQAGRRCTHLLVDEFQDLTPAYLLLVRLLAGPAGQVFGVGDDDQVIYGYAGADPGFLIDFEKFFPGARGYALHVNYRCPSGVVTAADRLLRHNKRRLAKTIQAGPQASPAEPQIVKAPKPEWAAQATRVVQHWLLSAEPERVAVLSRTQACLLPVQVYLRETGIPHHSLVDATILHRTGLRAALAWLRLAQGFSPPALQEALLRPSRKLKRELVRDASKCPSPAELLAFARRQEPWQREQLEEFVRDVRLLTRRLGEGGVPAALAALREEVGLGGALEELDHDASASHLDDLVALEQTAVLHPHPETFETWLTEVLQQRGKAGVVLATTHRVKGMEWDHVLVYGAQRGIWPHRLAEDREEERRVFHVALTRGRHQVTVLADQDSPSPFLKEMRRTKAEPDLEQLRDPERAAYLAVRVNGESYAAVAARMGKSVSAVRTWVQLAERTLG